MLRIPAIEEDDSIKDKPANFHQSSRDEESSELSFAGLILRNCGINGLSGYCIMTKSYFFQITNRFEFVIIEHVMNRL